MNIFKRNTPENVRSSQMSFMRGMILMIFTGVLFVPMSSCDSKLPFPEAKRATLVVLEKMDNLTSFTPDSDPDTEIKTGVRLHKFGGTEYSKVEICAVRNPTSNNYATAVMTEITRGLSVDDMVIRTFTLADVLSKTGGGSIECDDVLVFYYNLYMPDGVKTTGWSKVTGFTADKSVQKITGQVSYISYSVSCPAVD